MTPPITSAPLPRVLTTQQAAEYLNRSAQTLRTWACTGKGPIQPVKIGGRLGWPEAALRSLLEGGTAQ